MEDPTRARFPDVQPSAAKRATTVFHVEALEFQRAKLGRLRDGRVTQCAEFSTNVSMCGVHVDPEFSADFTKGAANLPQLERADAPLGDSLNFAARTRRPKPCGKRCMDCIPPRS